MYGEMNLFLHNWIQLLQRIILNGKKNLTEIKVLVWLKVGLYATKKNSATREKNKEKENQDINSLFYQVYHEQRFMLYNNDRYCVKQYIARSYALFHFWINYFLCGTKWK